MLQSGLETRSNLTVCLVGSPGLLNAASERSRAELTVKEQLTVLGRAGLAVEGPEGGTRSPPEGAVPGAAQRHQTWAGGEALPLCWPYLGEDARCHREPASFEVVSPARGGLAGSPDKLLSRWASSRATSGSQ